MRGHFRYTDADVDAGADDAAADDDDDNNNDDESEESAAGSSDLEGPLVTPAIQVPVRQLRLGECRVSQLLQHWDDCGYTFAEATESFGCPKGHSGLQVSHSVSAGLLPIRDSSQCRDWLRGSVGRLDSYGKFAK